MTLEEIGRYLDASVKAIESAKTSKEVAEKTLIDEVAEAEVEVAKIRAKHEKTLGIASQQYDDAIQKVTVLRKQLNEELDRISGIPQTRVR